MVLQTLGASLNAFRRTASVLKTSWVSLTDLASVFENINQHLQGRLVGFDKMTVDLLGRTFVGIKDGHKAVHFGGLVFKTFLLIRFHYCLNVAVPHGNLL